MSITEVGCCGAYCRTCRAYKERACKGCKTGYDTGEREIERAKCRIKICCMAKGFNSCADCPELTACPTIKDFHGKNGYKYKKYGQAIEFIRKNGYDAFVKIAGKWKNAYGKY